MVLGYYNYTVVLTYVGMLTAFCGVKFALDGNILAALLCLMISGVCDMFDGKIASTKTRTQSEKRFGIQIDSLSDLICFGVLPAFIVLHGNQHNTVTFWIANFYLLCTLVRLAYFNVDEEERQAQTQTARTVYLGLPVTTSALVTPAAYGIGQRMHWPVHIIAPTLLVVMGAGFLTPFQLKKPGLLGKAALILVGVAELLILVMGGGLS